MEETKRTAVMLDFDGTLVDNMRSFYEGIDNVFKHAGQISPSIEEVCATLSYPWLTWYRESGITADPEDLQKWFWEKYKGEAPLFTDVYSTLRTLHERGVLIGIITITPEEQVKTACREGNILEYVQLVLGESKDKAQSMQMFCSRYGVEKENALYVGDLGFDMRDALRAGIRAVGITRGQGTAQVLHEAGASACVESLDELLGLLP